MTHREGDIPLDIKSLLGLRPKDDSSEALKQALASAQAKRGELTTRIAGVDKRRADVLLDGDADDVVAIETELSTLRNEAERLTVMAEALPARIAEAERREGEAKLDDMERDARALSDEGLALVEQIEVQGRALAVLVERHDAIVKRQQILNDELRAGGRKRTTFPVERAWGCDGVGLGLSGLGMTLSVPSPCGGARSAEQLDLHIRNARNGVVSGGLRLPWPQLGGMSL
jgi:hypothetical protein